MNMAAAAEDRQETRGTSAHYRVCDPHWRDRDLPAPVAEIAAFLEAPRRLDEVIETSQISATRTRAVVRKLTALGVVARLSSAANDNGDAAPKPRPSHGFSEVEIAFFESEVEPIDECDEPFESWSERVSRRLALMAMRLQR